MKQYVVDAFSHKVFSGNQAAVCILDKAIPDELMLNIAKENNLSETAFAIKDGDKYKLRWFTPGGEIDLCGHATLACAYVLFKFYLKDTLKITFKTLSGDFVVRQNEDLIEMDFPAYQLEKLEVRDQIIKTLGQRPKEVYLGRDLLCVFDDEEIVRNLKPDLKKALDLQGLLLQVTAPSSNYDCVSRSFAPKLDVPEDPVCGSGHCHIVPYWSKKLGKNKIKAYQASERGGELFCKMNKDRVYLAGRAVIFSESKLNI